MDNIVFEEDQDVIKQFLEENDEFSLEYKSILRAWRGNYKYGSHQFFLI